MHILSATCVETKEKFHFFKGDNKWKDLLNDADVIAGHNIIGYDLMVLRKLFGFTLNTRVEVRDTLLLSQILDYNRFGKDGHSLKRWGEFLQFPKMEFDDWSQCSQEMIDYCDNDVELNVMVYKILRDEARNLAKKAPLIIEYLKSEHAAAKWQAEAQLEGWPFDVEAAASLHQTLQKELDIAYETLVPMLGSKAIAVDKANGVVAEKAPKFIKSGAYDSHTARWFEIDPWEGFEDDDRLVIGPYCRVKFADLNLNSVDDVKLFLYRHGWEPTEWNFKKEEGQRNKVKTSPKITMDSIEFLGGAAQVYSDFLTTKSRHSIVTTWLENVDERGNLHGDSMLVGTPSMRTRHSIIVNVPTANSKWGKEMRSLFKCDEGWILVGSDSAGNQARGLAHYLGDKEFIDTLLNGDIHQYNADKLTAVLKSIGVDHTVPRSDAKRVLYSFLFGAAGAKMWSYLFKTQNQVLGNKLKLGFTKAVPGFADLVKKLNNIYFKTSQLGYGYIPSIAGNRIYVDSSHKLLVYLLQSLEKITCATALRLTAERLTEAKIPYKPCVFYHDELDFQVPLGYEQQAAEIAKQAFIDGPKIFGVEIMDGESKIGKNWYEIH
jgi:DNA polymerase-1